MREYLYDPFLLTSSARFTVFGISTRTLVADALLTNPGNLIYGVEVRNGFKLR